MVCYGLRVNRPAGEHMVRGCVTGSDDGRHPGRRQDTFRGSLRARGVSYWYNVAMTARVVSVLRASGSGREMIVGRAGG